MNQVDVAHLRNLLQAATPGLWEVWTSCSWRRVCVSGPNPTPVIWPSVDRDGHPNLDRVENLELAVAAVNALPALLDELEVLRSSNDALFRLNHSLRIADEAVGDDPRYTLTPLGESLTGGEK